VSAAIPAIPPAALDALRQRAIGDLPPIAEIRPLLQSFHAEMREAFFRGLPAADVVHTRAQAIDTLMGALWTLCGLADTEATLLAVGGYGRGELHPYSDVDISILVPAGFPESARSQVEGFIRYYGT